MRPMWKNQGARRASLLGLVVMLGFGAALTALSGCGRDPSKPGGDPSRVQPPTQLPDDFPATGRDSLPPQPPGGGPGQPPVPPERGEIWVRFRAFNDGALPDVGLWILRGGRAAAMSLSEGPPAHPAWFAPDTMRIIAGWFDAAGIRDLTRDSYFSGGDPGRICEIFLCDSTREVHRIIGEERALPAPVLALAHELERLTTRVILATPVNPPNPPDSTVVPPPPVPPVPPVPPPATLRSELTVVPESAPEGTPRTIRLVVQNDTPDSVLLQFRTSQIYDFVLMDDSMMPPGGDSTWVPPNPPLPPNPPNPPNPPWPPDPPMPPHPPVPGDSTSVPPGGPTCPGGRHQLLLLRGPGMPPDSGGCGGGGGGRDTSWVPPDSTGPPHTPRLVWDWANGRGFLQVPMTVPVPPGGTLVYTETWNGTDNEGKIVASGHYMLMSTILSHLPVFTGMTRVEVTAP